MDRAAQIEMFERHEDWLQAQCLKVRGGRRQLELSRRIEQHIREYDRFLETHGWKVVHLVKKFRSAASPSGANRTPRRSKTGAPPNA